MTNRTHRSYESHSSYESYPPRITSSSSTISLIV